ncbi:3-keto-5-aminohexanoate cleavage protein, partial [Mesorhizobium sp. M2A.F.Ca.ET.040.01.1.1]
HPRGPSGQESLSAVDAAILAVRRACPGTPVGVSTGAWIEKDKEQTRSAIAGWKELPDYASVNLSESDAPAVMELLRHHGIGIEAGLASAADAERFVNLPYHGRVLRILIEIETQDLGAARGILDEITTVMDRAGLRRSILLHGSDTTVWPLVELAHQRQWSTRVGLEDGKHLPDGSIAADNAALVATAVAIYRAAPPG